MREGQEHTMYNFQKKLKGLKAKIKKWNKEEFGNIFCEKRCFEFHLQEIQTIETNEGYYMALKEEEMILEAKLEEREKQEEILWWKKSRIKWLHEGKKNTKFFHHSVIQYRFQNKIYFLKNDRGEKVELREDIEVVLNSQFLDILSDPRRNRLADIEAITSRISTVVSGEENQLLMKTITIQEVHDAVFQMKEGTSSGPDGFTANFFHHF